MENRRKLHLTIKLWIRDFEHPEVLGFIRIYCFLINQKMCIKQ